VAERELPVVRLRAERERSVRRRHPWLMSGSIEAVEGEPAPGAGVLVVDSRGRPLGWGDWDPGAQIRVRICEFGDAKRAAPADWLRARLRAALHWRTRHALLQDTDALRLVHAEADGLPGLIVDRYADHLVVRPGTPGMLARVPLLAELLAAAAPARGAWLRGEPQRGTPVAERALFGEIPGAPIEIHERGRHYAVDLRRGQKTGFYLDQRDARDLFQRLAPGARAADLFCYTGGFAAAALAGGAASVVAVDTSESALALLAQNAPGAAAVCEDVAEYLRRDPGPFDLIALDPPPLARRKRDVPAAARAYKDLILRALRRAAPGAHLLAFSCSHHVDPWLLRSIAFGAAEDAGRDVQLLGLLGAPPDHPVALVHPEGEYLKGLLLRVAY
jgi:23S rRNA (cytosine1962-C5)-methyltransferase